jgi:hypothetical protein
VCQSQKAGGRGKTRHDGPARGIEGVGGGGGWKRDRNVTEEGARRGRRVVGRTGVAAVGAIQMRTWTYESQGWETSKGCGGKGWGGRPGGVEGPDRGGRSCGLEGRGCCKA